MRKIYPFLPLLFCCCYFFSTAQVRDGYRFLKKDEFNSALRAFEADREEDKTSVQALYGIENVYADSNFIYSNLDSAYIYTNLALLRYRKLKYDVRKKVQRQISSSEMNTFKRQIEERAVFQASEENTIEAYEN